jgi:gamma-glutamylcyclotransferase (GGCT)/AIG2-like uncharacterized protein YtfP
LAALDRLEGVNMNPPVYQRVQVQVFAPDGHPHDAITYEVFDKAAQGHAPSADYLGLIADGARKWGLPNSYQDFLSKIPSEG